MIRLPWHARADQQQAQQEAEAALAASHADLQRTRARDRDVRRVAARLRKLQHENHFAENIRAIYGGQQP